MSSFADAQVEGFFGYPDDLDDYQSEVKPSPTDEPVAVAVEQIPPATGEASYVTLDGVCGGDNERLLALGYAFDLCHREPDHPGFCHHIAL